MRQSKKTADEDVQAKGQTIFAYAFDGAGFQCPAKPVVVDGIGTVLFVKFEDSVRLDEADGVITPTGIFERPAVESGNSFGSSFEQDTPDDLLMARERQVGNLIKDGKWVCFLVRALIDRPSQSRFDVAADTDLVKRVLSSLGIGRLSEPSGLQASDALCPEFTCYLRDYGVAQTSFYVRSFADTKIVSIAKCGGNAVALEAGRQYFFLPFNATRRDSEGIANLVRVVADSVVRYRENHREDIPEWADAFEFAEESSLRQERSALTSHLTEIGDCIGRWRITKSILFSFGDVLRDRLVSILRDYFGLTIDPSDEHREDAKVVGAKGQTLVLLEAKASSGGVSRKDVSQIGFHRDKAGTPLELPGVLITNCGRSLNTITERLGCSVHADQVHYAKSQNVLIVRTIDLLLLMRQLETKTVTERREALMKAFLAGGGWLKASEASYEIVTE